MENQLKEVGSRKADEVAQFDNLFIGNQKLVAENAQSNIDIIRLRQDFEGLFDDNLYLRR